VAAIVVRRVLWSMPLLLLVMLVTFALLRGMGGSPFRLEEGGVPPALQVQLEDYYGLDDPWLVEFAHYVRNVATLDFGPSLVNRYTTVDQIVEERFPVSGQLVLLACAWAVPLGVGFGLLGALRRNTWADYVVTALATAMLVVPVFLVAGVVSTYFVRDWGIVADGWETRQAKVLPTLVLALAPPATSPGSSAPQPSRRSSSTTCGRRGPRGSGPAGSCSVTSCPARSAPS
jgi:ABC-type dipeptide/oligopeptide/nickel transport system permease component